MSADTIPSEVVDQVADIIDQNELGYSITLTRLVDGIETWTLAMDGETHEFDFREDAAEVVATKRRRLQAARVIEATAAILATRPAEPAAPVAEVKAWLLGDPATGQWIEVDGHRVEYSRGMGTPAHVLASAFQAERARADAAEQRAAVALARAEKAEGALAEAQGALVDLADWLENDCGAELPHSHIEKQVALARSDARASREAQPATDGGDNG